MKLFFKRNEELEDILGKVFNKKYYLLFSDSEIP